MSGRSRGTAGRARRGTAPVHDGTAYLGTCHDEAPTGVEDFVMRDWHCFSFDDMLTWRPHGPLLNVERFGWARDGAKAGTVVEGGGRFFWYVAVNHASIDGGAIGVAVADRPTGPFRDALGAALVTNELPFDTGDDHTIDPSMIVHDEQAHLFWGKERCFSVRLDDSMTALAGPITEIELPSFKEGAHVHERDGWYFFYHNGVLPGGGSHRRSVCVDRLTYDADGRMNRVHMTTEGLRAA